MKKSFISIVAVLVICFSLAGCESDDAKAAREAQERVKMLQERYEDIQKESKELEKTISDYEKAVDKMNELKE